MSVFHDRVARMVYTAPSQIQVVETLHNILRGSKAIQIDLTEAIPRYEKYLQPVVAASSILELLQVDPDAVEAKALRVGEYLVKPWRARNFGLTRNRGRLAR